MELKLAEKSDINQIMRIFKISFNETDENLKIFFEEKFKLDKCIVYVVDKQIVALLNMFDTKLVGKNCFEKANYIYGAATHPEHRKKGYMGKLINYSNKLAYNNGHKYSILLPATYGLYDYYQKLGYIKFFKARFISISNSELKEYINSDFKEFKALSFDNMSKLRFNICKDYTGTAIWNSKDIKYAVNMNKNYGGDTIFSNEGYAICYVSGDNILHVIEFMVTKKDFNNLLTSIYKKYPNLNYRFRLPVFNTYFNKKGEINNFGMLKPLNNDIKYDIINESAYPYLGLTLD